MMQIVLATSNPHKVEEINAIAKPYDISFILPPSEFNPVENGEDFESNSLIKALAAYNLTHQMTLADDSGLCVDALNGAPGIHSARYADSAEARIEKLLDALKDIPENKRDAKFVCAMTLLDEKGNISLITRAECLGEIGFEKKGLNGFGYDPIFIVNDKNCTMAELSEEEKNLLSHRGKALTQILTFIKKCHKNHD